MTETKEMRRARNLRMREKMTQDPDYAEKVRARMKALYQIDRDAPVRVSHKNLQVQRLYDEFLGQPLGHKSHELLHTHYAEREVTV